MKKKKVNNNLIGTVSLLMVANFLVKIFGLLREILLASYYGTSIYTDSYIIANNIPTVLFAAIGASLATTFIPMYSNIKERQSERRANEFALHLIEMVLVVCLVLTFIGEVWTKQVVFIFASGFEGERLSTTIEFTRILFPGIVGIALMNLLGSYLQLQNKFIPVALVTMLGNITIIITLVISNYVNNIYILVWGTLLGITVQIVYYVPWVVKSGIFNCTSGKIADDGYIVPLLKLIIPVFVGESVNELNTIVDRTLVSGLEVGSVSSLNYAYKIILLVTGIFIASVVTIMYPKLSRLAAEKNDEHFKQKSNESVLIIFLLVLPITIAVIMFREEIVQLLFQRGNFDSAATAKTAIALKYYSLGIVALGIRDILAKMFYSKQDTKTPMKNGVFCACTNIALDYVLIKFIGFSGAALATAIVANIGALNLLRIANAKKMIEFRTILEPILKGICGGVIVIVFYCIAKNVVSSLELNFYLNIIVCGIIGGIGIVLYGVLQVVLKNEIVINFLRRVCDEK